MRGWLIAACLFAPLLANAEVAPELAWSSCVYDSDCVVIEGVCNPTAVHVGFKKVATESYQERKSRTKCTKQFWQLSMDQASTKCHLERCVIVEKENSK